MKRIFFFGVLILGGILFPLVLAEAILRLFPGILPTELQQIIRLDPHNTGIAHPYIGHLHKPNSALVISGRDFSAVRHTDGNGFGNRWPWPDTAEIITLGDSLTFGWGVEDTQTWPAILARAFPENRVINLAVCGAGPQQYSRIYETFGVKLRPKVVLVGLFVRNDFWDAELFDRWLKSGAGGSYIVWREFGRPASVSLSLQQPVRNLVSSLVWRARLATRKSYVGNLLRYAVGNLKMWIPSRTRVIQAGNGAQLELQPEAFYSDTRLARPGNPVFGLVVEALQRIDSLAEENGATPLFVFLPSKEEVYLPLLGEPPPDPAAPLRASLKERGIPYLDLLEEFRRHAAKGEVLFFEVDGHPNGRGYALIAELVTSYVKQHAKEYGLQEKEGTAG